MLRALHLASLLAIAMWVVVPPIAGFDASTTLVHGGYLLTLAVWIGSMVGLCARRLRGEDRRR